MTRKEREQLVRRQYILDAAATVFSRDGYEKASMNEIATLSEFTKRTLYQYFDDKADLFLSVLLEHYKKFCNEMLTSKYETANGLGIIRQSLYRQYDYYKSHTGTFRMMYDIGKVRMLTDNPKVQEFLALDRQITESMMDTIALGQEDGSISTKHDARTTTINLKFFTTATFDKLVTTSEYYAKHVGISVDDFAHSLLELIIDALRP